MNSEEQFGAPGTGSRFANVDDPATWFPANQAFPPSALVAGK